MQTFDTWDIIKVPFPYTDRPVRERRPALVVASASIQELHGLLWVMMITSSPRVLVSALTRETMRPDENWS